MSDMEDVSYSTLIDSGAIRSFVDKSIAEKFPQNVITLERPVPLELFDGQPTSAGEISKAYKDSISFADGTIQTVEFLVTRLHPTAPVVLGLPWLRKFNPDINWSDLSLAFRESNARISAALAEDIIQWVELNESGEARKQQRKRRAATVQEVEEEERKPERKDFPAKEEMDVLGSDAGEDPILLGMNEWLAFGDWIAEYNNDVDNWKQEYHIGGNNHGYSEKAFQAWVAKGHERTSKLPAYQQKRCWIHKRVGKMTTQVPAKVLSPKTQKIPTSTKLQHRQQRTKRGIWKKGDKKQVEKREGPNLPGK